MFSSRRLCSVVAVLSLTVLAQAETLKVCFRSGSSLALVDRTFAGGQSAADAAAVSLAAGPTPEEFAAGIFTAIPAGTQVQQVTLDGDTLTVDFSEAILDGLTDARLADIYDQVKTTFGLLDVATNVRITSGGQVLSSYLPPVSGFNPDNAGPAPVAAAEPQAAGALTGHSITLSPGHGWVWTGSGWHTERPVYCSPLNEEDFHTNEIAAYLRTFLEQDGMLVKSVRCLDKNFGTEPLSGKPWWQVSGYLWLKQLGYPCSVYGPLTGCTLGSGSDEGSDGIRARALASNYDNTDIYVSLHTNGFQGDCSGSCPTGSETYYDAGTEHAAYGAVSQALATNVQNNLMAILQQQVDSTWTCHGACVKNSDGAYGEIRVPTRAAVLTELAFHDSCTRDADANHLRDNFYRCAAMYGMYKGICGYFGATPTYDFYSAEYVSDNIPTEMVAGRPYSVSIILRNRGGLWKDARGYRLGAVGGSDPFVTAARVSIAGEVGPGETYTFSFEMVPQGAGDFTTDWQMVRDGWPAFGPIISKTVHVLPSDDTQPPSTPAGLTAHALSQTSIQLAWPASTDNVRVVGYEIRRDGAVIGTSATNSFTDTGCTEDTPYTYEVRAYDFPLNYSDWSAPVTARTPVYDFEPPTVPQNLTVLSSTLTSVQIGWDASTDNVNLVGYEVRRNGTTLATVAGTTYTDSGHQPGESFTYEVRAKDWVPNFSAWSAPLAAGPLPDIEPPSTPADLLAVAAGPTKVLLTWTASTDNYTLTGYQIRRNGVVIGTSTTASYFDNAAVANTAYTYEVCAKDAVPNYSPYSAPATATTPTAPVVVFQDGFNGNMDNWVQQIPFTYAAVTHGTYPGAGSARCPAGASSQMYKPFARPFAEGKVSAYYRDPRGGRGSACAFLGGTQVLSLREPGGGDGFILDNGLSANATSQYTWRLLGCGGTGMHTAYANRPTTSACRPLWFYFETQVVANPPGIFPAATFFARVTDSSGTVESWQTIPNDNFFTAGDGGIGRITLGLGEPGDADIYWDDVRFEAFAPRAPLAGGATTLSSTSILWTFARNVDNSLYGFDVADETDTVRSPNYPASGWLNRSAISWTEDGLAANTTYTRKVRAWNGTLNSGWSDPLTAKTLSAPPSAASITSERVAGSTDVRWTAVGGFGAGTVEYYRYAWNQSATYTFSGTEPTWASGDLVTSPAGSGDWYLHVQGFNSADLPNGTYDYLLPCGDADGDSVADCLDNCPAVANTNQADSNGNGIGDACETHAIVAWRSVRTHKDFGALSIALNAAAVGQGAAGPTVEPRGTPANGIGVSTIEVDLDGPMSLVNSSAVSVTCWPTVDGVMGAPLTLTPVVSMVDADTMRIALTGVPDGSCVHVVIPAGTFAETLTGDNDCLVRSIAGDATGNGIVDVLDMAEVKSRLGGSVLDNPRFDLTLNGTIDVVDMALAKSRLATTPKAVCP